MKTLDHFTIAEIKRPYPNALRTYDFDFRKKIEKHWSYINSTDNIDAFEPQIKAVEEHNGLYQIVEARTNKVVKTNKK